MLTPVILVHVKRLALEAIMAPIDGLEERAGLVPNCFQAAVLAGAIT
jgi:hypothetical protein